MTTEELKEYLTSQSVVFEEYEIEHGTQLRCDSGEIFNSYKTGRVVCQGAKTAIAEEIKAMQVKKPFKAASSTVVMAQPRQVPQRKPKDVLLSTAGTPSPGINLSSA